MARFKHIHITLTNDEYEKLNKIKEGKKITWDEMLINAYIEGE